MITENGLIILNNSSQNNKERLNGFKKKSEVQRQAHADLASKYSQYIIGSNIFIIFASGIIAFLAFSDPKKILEPLQIIVNLFGIKANFDYALAEALFTPVLGFLGLAVFLLSLISLICGWSDKVLKHGEGVRLFTDLITDIRDIIDSSNATAADEEPNENQVSEIKKKIYADMQYIACYPRKSIFRIEEEVFNKKKRERRDGTHFKTSLEYSSPIDNEASQIKQAHEANIESFISDC